MHRHQNTGLRPTCTGTKTHTDKRHAQVSAPHAQAQAQASGPHAQAQKHRPLAHMNIHKNTRKVWGAKNTFIES